MSGRDPLGAEPVRSLLLGRSGPYADPRVVTDSLDDLEVLVAGLDPSGRDRLALTLLQLVGDDDVVVATGAVLGLRQVIGPVHVDAALDRATSSDGGLDRPPIGFAAAQRPTIRAELLDRVAVVADASHRDRIEPVLADPPGGVSRADLAMELAARFPDLILRNAVDWFTSDDVGVMTRLPTAWHRRAIAGALAPWPAAAHDTVDRVAGWLRWDELDTAALHRAMTGEDALLNRPEGLDDGRRWWIVAGEPWDWTVWRSADGATALEVVRSGWSLTATTRVLTAEEAEACERGGPAAIRDLVERQRRA